MNVQHATVRSSDDGYSKLVYVDFDYNEDVVIIKESEWCDFLEKCILMRKSLEEI